MSRDMQSRTQTLPCEIATLSVDTKVRERTLNVSIQFKTADGDIGKILWFVSRERTSVDFTINDASLMLMSVTDDYRNPDVSVTSDLEMSRNIPKLSLVFTSALTAALQDPELIKTLSLGVNGNGTTQSSCDTACGAAGGAAGAVAGVAVAGACTGGSAGFATPGCTYGGAAIAGAAGSLFSAGCSWLFC
ncbi:hypothetical protein [Microcoleus vaginatus]|uniref:hypothetical protein n=1 Tax=Microcoleus vaginatus TaxID=119532 RepID=UPI001F6164BF